MLITDLLCRPCPPGLGDAWGQPSRAGPLDSVAKELGSHLLQVGVCLGEGIMAWVVLPWDPNTHLEVSSLP